MTILRHYSDYITILFFPFKYVTLFDPHIIGVLDKKKDMNEILRFEYVSHLYAT